MNILNKLTLTHLKLNKRRTIVTILAIAISTVLMLGVSLAFSTLKQLQIDLTESFSGDQHVTFKDMPIDKIKTLDSIKDVERYNYSKAIGISGKEYSYYVTVKGNKGLIEKIVLSKGEHPKNSNEIIVSEKKYKIGDDYLINDCKVRLDDKKEDTKIEKILTYDKLNLHSCKTTTAKVVGIIKEDIYPNKISIALANNYVLDDNIDNYKEDAKVFVRFKDIKKVQEGIDRINATSHTDYNINKELLAANGVVKYGNITKVYNRIILAVLTVLVVGCSIVIYNSFAISVMERKKQFGTLSSIGTTKRQIIRTVFFEVLIVGILGIILGVVLSYLIAFIGVYLINVIADGTIAIKVRVASDFSFISISLIYIVLTIIISAIIPALKASRFSPIELIRQSDDIKIKSKKVRSPKFIEKFFGIEGSISYKNMKRNKKKYRISVISLVIGIILFIAAYTFSTGIKKTLTASFNNIQVNSVIHFISSNKDKETIKNIETFANRVYKNSNIKDPLILKQGMFVLKNFDTRLFTGNNKNVKEEHANIHVIEVDKQNFNNMLKKIGKKEIKPIVYNKDIIISYNNKKRITTIQNKFKSAPKSLEFSDGLKVNDFYVDSFEYNNDGLFNSNAGFVVLLVPEGYFNDKLSLNQVRIYFDTIDVEAFKSDLEKYAELDRVEYEFINISEIAKGINKILLIFNGFVYAFIILVSMVGITSIINTIATSMNLRKKEFAMLRSIGLTTSGFNKILILESIFIAIKAILYSIPFSMLIIYGYNHIIKDVMEGEFYIPWRGILSSMIMVFLIILIITIYSTRKIKKENILDALKMEAI